MRSRIFKKKIPPREGETRIRDVFLLIPRCLPIGDCSSYLMWRWLEKARVLEKFKIYRLCKDAWVMKHWCDV